MPLVRFEVRNEYGLAEPELYNGRHEDPKPAFEGIAVAGLVGILRQLGDLAEFAADIFHDLHEQVMITGARGQQILSRVQKIESALLPLEKAVQNQSNHIHFAYIAGCDWHPYVRTGQSRLICSELPQYMVDSYDECRDPPRLYLLDNFDDAGPGACLRRYSDPSYFRRALTASEAVKPEKVKRRKKKKSRPRSRDVHQVLTPQESSSTQFESPSTDQLSFSIENISIIDGRPKSEFERESASFDSETRVNFEDTNTSFMVHDELEYNLPSIPTSIINPGDVFVHVLHNEPIEDTADDSQHDSLQQQSVPSSCSVTWDEKTEIVKPNNPKVCEEVLVDRVEDAESLPLSFTTSNLGHQNAKPEENSQEYIVFDIENLPVLLSGGTHFDEVTSGTKNYIDAKNILESEIEIDGECQTKQEVKSLQNLNYGDLKPELSELEGRTISSLDDFDGLDPAASCSSTNDSISPRLSNFILLACLEHDQSICTTDFSPEHDSVGSDYSRSHISNVSGVNGSEGPNDDLFQEVKSLSKLSYADLKAEVSEVEGRTISRLDGFDGLAPAASCSSTNDYISPILPNFITLEGLECDQSICTTGFATTHDSVGSDHSGNHISIASGVNGSDVLNDDLFQEVKSLPHFIYADSKPELSELDGETLSNLDEFDGLSPAASCSSTNDSLPLRLSNLIPSEDLERDQSVCTTVFSPKHDFVASDHSESHISNVSGVNGSEGINDDPSPESNTIDEHIGLVEDIKAKIINPLDPAAASIQVQSLNCWTNGGIFGVEPSKPPDLGILYETVATSETLVMSREITFAEESAKLHPVKQNSQESSQDPSQGEHVKNGELPTYGTYAYDHGLDKKETNATALGSNLFRCTTIGSQFNSCDQSISSSISDLAQRFLANNLQRTSVNHTDMSTMSHSVNAHFRKSQEISLQDEHQALSNGVVSRVSHGLDKERMVVVSSVHSLSASLRKTGSSSPPLEHMKMSFQPMNGLQASKLKLEFCCGDVDESNGDLTFPSFQLIPGPSTASLDSGSESDDDTFCRYSYSSQCLFSPHSESNSELWGEDERSGTQENTISDNSCRLSSSTTSICSSLEFEKMDGCRIYPVPESENLELESGLVLVDSDPTRDLPGIDSVIFAKKQEQAICDSLTNDPINSTPLSPNELPLSPPMQWQVVLPSSSLEFKYCSGDQSDAHTQSSVTPEHQDQDVPRWPCNVEGVAPPRNKTYDQWNLNGHIELSNSYNSEEPDEREDLLQKIRSKSN